MGEDILLAPNGKETNLTPELYEYVRTPEFKARYGDWEHGRSSTPLDGNGEPLVLWHGSPKSFDAFDFSHAGENTGLVEYTDRKTGEKVTSDSGRAMFFTDNRELAVSYAFLAKTQEYSEMCSCLSDCISLMHLSGLANSRIKSADDFREFVRKVRRGDDRELIDAFAKVVITKDHPVSRLDESLRNDIREKLIRIRSRYSERYQMNRTGGLSNQLNNYVRQSKYYRYFAANFDRVCSNDMTVKTEFDTDLTQHNISFFGPDGNYGLSFHQEGTRIVMNGYGDGPVHVDTLSLVQRSQILSRIQMDLNEGIGKFNREIRKSGYADAVHLYPVFLKSDNPLIHDYRGSSFPDKYKLDEKYDTAYVAARQVSRAVEQGKDAVVYANIRDPFLGTSYGVFSAEQIEILSKDMGLDISPELKWIEEEETAILFRVKPAIPSLLSGHTAAMGLLLRDGHGLGTDLPYTMMLHYLEDKSDIAVYSELVDLGLVSFDGTMYVFTEEGEAIYNDLTDMLRKDPLYIDKYRPVASAWDIAMISDKLNEGSALYPGTTNRLWSKPPYSVVDLKYAIDIHPERGSMKNIESVTIRNGNGRIFTVKDIDKNNNIRFSMKYYNVTYGLQTGRAYFVRNGEKMEREADKGVKRSASDSHVQESKRKIR